MLTPPRSIAIAATVLAAAGCSCGSKGARAALVADPASLDFGTTAPGARVDLPVVVTNQTQDPVNVTGANINPSTSPFEIAPAGAATLGPRESITYTVSYLPMQSGSDSGKAMVNTDLAVNADLAVPLTGAADSSVCLDSLCTHPPGSCYQATGKCSGGACSYPAVPAGTACDDGNPCTIRDVCSTTGACAGTPITCNSPPPPSCLGATVQRTFTFPGVCNAKGACVYPEKDTPCATNCDATTGRCAGCVPTTCSAQNVSCGPLSDGCGNTLNCGSCQAPPPPVCVNSTTSRTFLAPGTCAAASCNWGTQDTVCSTTCNSSTGLCATCSPTTCAAQGKNCGSVPDGCNGSLSCGTCPAGESCGGGGVANVCGSATCSTSCASWVDCTSPGYGCDSAKGCCVPCGGTGQPCCVDFTAGLFFCGSSADVCGSSIGNGGAETYSCCSNQGDGCCVQGGCGSIGNCCSCPRNGLNFCVDPAFGCGGC